MKRSPMTDFADDDCDKYGIQMVKLQDPQLAKRYGIKTFPALVYFRNGNPLTYDGKNIAYKLLRQSKELKFLVKITHHTI